jgi:predicted O-methyltransferase YrrM
VEFRDVKAAVEGIPFTTPWLGRQLYDAIREAGARDVLELGTAHATATAYMAAAVAANGGGLVTTVDRYRFGEWDPEETVDRAGLAQYVRFVREEHSSYTWWLKGLIQQHSDSHGNCEPQFDFCFLDGAHDWHIDGLAVVLVERLLRPGSWLVLDDYRWTYEGGTAPEHLPLSDEERRADQIAEVFDVVLRPHPSFDSFRVVDDAVAWARKGDGPRRLVLETTTTRSDILLKRLRMAARRLRARREE